MPRPLRVVLQQPALPKYRIPVFRALARRAGISLQVIYGAVRGLPNASPDGFAATFWPLRSARAGGRELARWHQAALNSQVMRDADVLVLDDSPRYLSAIPTLLRARAHGIGTVLWGHGLWGPKPARGSRALRALAMSLADCSLLYSESAVASLRARGWAQERLFAAPNTLDMGPLLEQRAHWGPEALEAFRRRHGLRDARVVLFISRLSEERRVDVLIEALRQLGARPVVLVVIGSGPAEARCRQLVERYGLADRVRFLGELYEESALAPWFLSADVACLPAGVGLNIVHAFGYGLPVVASAEGSHPEIGYLRHEDNGLRLPRLDAATLGAALARLLDDEPLARRLRAGASAMAGQELSIERMVDGLEAAIRAAARRRS